MPLRKAQPDSLQPVAERVTHPCLPQKEIKMSTSIDYDKFVVTSTTKTAPLQGAGRPRTGEEGPQEGRETLFFNDGHTRIDIIIAYQVRYSNSKYFFVFLNVGNVCLGCARPYGGGFCRGGWEEGGGEADKEGLRGESEEAGIAHRGGAARGMRMLDGIVVIVNGVAAVAALVAPEIVADEIADVCWCFNLSFCWS